MATWKNVGLYVILFVMGLETVPTQYYEAAKLEGMLPAGSSFTTLLYL